MQNNFLSAALWLSRLCVSYTDTDDVFGDGGQRNEKAEEVGGKVKEKRKEALLCGLFVLLFTKSKVV